MASTSIPSDDLVWLEPPHSPEALQWAEQQSKTATEYLEAQPEYSKVLQELQHLAKVNKPRPSFTLAGDVIFMLEKTATNRKGVLKVANRGQDASTLNWRTILDIEQLGRDEGKKWEFSTFGTYFPHFLFPNGKSLLVRLSDGGADVSELRELDMETGKFVEGGFYAPQCLMSVICLDMDHILIGHTLHDSPKTTSGWPTTAYIWKRGTDLQDAKPVFSAKASDALTGLMSIKIGKDPLACVLRRIDFSTVTFHLVSLDGAVTDIPLPSKLRSSIVMVKPHIIVSLTNAEEVEGKEYPPGSILAYDTSPRTTSRISVVYIPAVDEFITEISKGGSSSGSPTVILTFKGRGSEKYMTLHFENGTWQVGKTYNSAPGSSFMVMSPDRDSNDTIVMESGVLTPAVLRLESPGRAAVELYSQPGAFDASLYKLDLNVANSKDGTEVDYYLVQKKGASKSQAPVLMTGYGGFAISYPTDYLNALMGGISLVPWLERGGALAIAMVRGGLEQGEEWHNQSKREKRQNSFDDFCGVAEHMIKDGFTTPQHIGIFGTSNGGLLTAVAGTQRPDLFGAVVNAVPLTDMIRFPLMGMGALWTDEFGDPVNAEDAKFLRAYSPFHNVKTGTKYPPFLITTATNDDRAGVGHGRKFAAKLKEAEANVFYLEDLQGGHGVNDPFNNTGMLAKRMTFFIGNLM